MKTKELVGKITFQENINSLQTNILPKTLVIDIPDPYKSYYSRFTAVNTRPNSIVFILKKGCSLEKALIVTQKINKAHNLNLLAGKCEVTIKGKSYFGIRLKNIGKYGNIKTIQQHYADENFGFSKQETWKDKEAVIKVTRFFNVKEIKEHLYESTEEEGRVYYIDMPNHMRWEAFKKATLEINHNTTDKSYDIAKVVFYRNGGIDMMLRVVKPKASVEFLENIREKYLKKS